MLILRGVKERDIDLLFAEELVSTPEFAAWFGSKIGLDNRARLKRVERSVISATRGESDLVLTYDVDGRDTAVLVENKIDAVFQDRQAERYQERAKEAIASGTVAHAHTVVIAPVAYTRAEEGFDAIVRYEEILSWFKDFSVGDARAMCKVELLNAALGRAEEGWTLVPDAASTAFWGAYYDLVMSHAFELGMKKPGKKPATSGFVFFKPRGLAKRVKLLHKVPFGNVDLQFDGQGHRLEEFQRRYHGRLDPEMAFELAGESLVNRISVPRIPLGTPFEEARPSILGALARARQLLAWYRREVVSEPTSSLRVIR